MLESRLAAAPDLDPRRLGGQLWGIDDGLGSSLRAAVFCGGNLIPTGDDLAGLELIAERVSRTSRGCSSIVGASEAVQAVWSVLVPRWGPARAVRQAQPLLVTRARGPVPADPAVRRVRTAELRLFLPAAIAMFTEELGVSPIGADAGAGYRSRVSELIGSGRAFARFDERGRVQFKAEIGVLGSETAQIQGVWVRPDLRGQGIGTAATAAVIEYGLYLAPSVSLYVNDFNLAARRMYDRLGLRESRTLSTVLF